MHLSLRLLRWNSQLKLLFVYAIIFLTIGLIIFKLSYNANSNPCSNSNPNPSLNPSTKLSKNPNMSPNLIFLKAEEMFQNIFSNTKVAKMEYKEAELLTENIVKMTPEERCVNFSE